jgi:mediator of RNA polymerase II transcription subunit 31
MNNNEYEGNQSKDEILQLTQDIEFVQLLANPSYLKYLAENNYLEDPQFINYLNYLNYVKSTEFIKFIIYPLGLTFLNFLQLESFRKELINNKDFPNYLMYLIENDWMSKNLNKKFNEFGE